MAKKDPEELPTPIFSRMTQSVHDIPRSQRLKQQDLRFHPITSCTYPEYNELQLIIEPWVWAATSGNIVVAHTTSVMTMIQGRCGRPCNSHHHLLPPIGQHSSSRRSRLPTTTIRTRPKNPRCRKSDTNLRLQTNNFNCSKVHFPLQITAYRRYY